MKQLKLSFLLVIIQTSYLSAQNFLFQDLPKENFQIGFSFMHPSFERNSDLSVLTGVYDFSVNVPLSDKDHLFFEPNSFILAPESKLL